MQKKHLFCLASQKILTTLSSNQALKILCRSERWLNSGKCARKCRNLSAKFFLRRSDLSEAHFRNMYRELGHQQFYSFLAVTELEIDREFYFKPINHIKLTSLKNNQSWAINYEIWQSRLYLGTAFWLITLPFLSNFKFRKIFSHSGHQLL